MSYEIGPLSSSHVYINRDAPYSATDRRVKLTLREMENDGTAHPQIVGALREVVEADRKAGDQIKTFREHGRWLIGNFFSHARKHQQRPFVGLLYAQTDPSFVRESPRPLPEVMIATWVNERRADDLGLSTDEVRDDLKSVALHDMASGRRFDWRYPSMPVNRDTRITENEGSYVTHRSYGLDQDMEALRHLPVGMPETLRNLLIVTTKTWHENQGTGL